MGSSSLEITLIELFNGLYRKIDSFHTFNIGGDDFTGIIISILTEEFRRYETELDAIQFGLFLIILTHLLLFKFFLVKINR